MIVFPYLIAFLTGGLCFRVLTQKEQVPPLLSLMLSGGLGMALSSHITFYSYVFFDGLNKAFVIAFHLILLIALIFLNRKFHIKAASFAFMKKPGIWLAMVIFVILCIPLWIQAKFYPFGGWDAWSCWNLKAKFLYSGGEEWKNIFDPVLWRASPHYPLLLPLINVWGWIFTKATVYLVPLINAVVFTLLTVGLIFSGLKTRVGIILAAAGVALILTLPFFIQLAVSQYSDIVLSYYLLAGFVCFLIAGTKDSMPFAFLSGAFSGFLTFTKPEGMIAGVLAVAIFFISLVFAKQKSPNMRKNLLMSFLAGFLPGILPTVLFQVLYAPANQTFVNGFTSALHPLTAGRIKLTALFFLIEPLSEKWNGAWILLCGGLLLSKGKCFAKTLLIFPAFLLLYLAIVFAYYLANTYFEISWWLSVTFNRILFSLLPIAVFWVFAALEKPGLPAKD